MPGTALDAPRDDEAAAERAPFDGLALERAYLQLAQEREGDHASRAAAQAYLDASPAKYHGGETVPWGFVPKLFSRRDAERLAHMAETMGAIMDKLTRAYRTDPAVRRAFGFSPLIERLSLAPVPYRALIPIARVDVFLDERTGAYKFCELNTDGSAGMMLTTEVGRALQGTATYRVFAESHALAAYDLYGQCADAVISCAREALGDDVLRDGLRIAAVDYAESVYLAEIQELANAFEARGARLRFTDVRDLSYRDGVLSDAQGPIDAVFHRVVTGELADKPCPGADALAACAEEGRVPIVGAFRTWPAATKTAFAVFHSPLAETFLTPEELVFVRAHVPETVVLDEKTDLSRFRNRSRWIAKPADGYAGKGVVAGLDATDDSWAETLAELAGVHGIVQEYVPQPSMPFMPGTPSVDSEGSDDTPAFEVNAMIGLYLFNGRFGGVFTRVGMSNIIDYTTSRYNLATFVVD